jgi:hypothetical protein
MLNLVDWVRFHLDYVVKRQTKNAFEPAGNIHRPEDIETVRQLVAFSENPINLLPVPTIRETLLSRLKGKVSPRDGSAWKQSPESQYSCLRI